MEKRTGTSVCALVAILLWGSACLAQTSQNTRSGRDQDPASFIRHLTVELVPFEPPPRNAHATYVLKRNRRSGGCSIKPRVVIEIELTPYEEHIPLIIGLVDATLANGDTRGWQPIKLVDDKGRAVEGWSHFTEQNPTLYEPSWKKGRPRSKSPKPLVAFYVMSDTAYGGGSVLGNTEPFRLDLSRLEDNDGDGAPDC